MSSWVLISENLYIQATFVYLAIFLGELVRMSSIPLYSFSNRAVLLFYMYFAQHHQKYYLPRIHINCQIKITLHSHWLILVFFFLQLHNWLYKPVSHIYALFLISSIDFLLEDWKEVHARSTIHCGAIVNL